jgi:hypothetical protein
MRVRVLALLPHRSDAKRTKRKRWRMLVILCGAKYSVLDRVFGMQRRRGVGDGWKERTRKDGED